jgi:hypothetical protein
MGTAIDTRSRQLSGALLVMLAVAVALVAPGRASAADRLFAPDSFWNAPLPAQVDVDQTGLAAGLLTQVRSEEQANSGPWINISAYSTPLYVAGPNAPGVPVKTGTATGLAGLFQNRSLDRALDAAMSAVPIPPAARQAAGTDGTLTVWQPSSDTLWELARANRQSDGWHALWGGRVLHVSQSPGFYMTLPGPGGLPQERAGWGASVTNLPYAGGLIRPAELAAGQIDHALALAVPLVRANVVTWPAHSTDGDSSDPSAIPEGTRLRIDPALDLAALNLPAPVLAIARAAQRYGIVVRDRADAVAFYAEDPASIGSDPYPGLLGSDYPFRLQRLMAQFPWEHLQAFTVGLAASVAAGPRFARGRRRVVVGTATCNVACHLTALTGVAHSGRVTMPVRELNPGSTGTAHTLVATLPRRGSGRRINASVRLTAVGAAQGAATTAARVTLRRAVSRKTKASG